MCRSIDIKKTGGLPDFFFFLVAVKLRLSRQGMVSGSFMCTYL